MTASGFIIDALAGLFPKWMPTEVMKAVLPLMHDAWLDGDRRLTELTRAHWQSRLDETLRGVGIRSLE